MEFDAKVWTTRTHEGWSNGEDILNYVGLFMDNLKEYIGNLEGEVERLEKVNEKLDEKLSDAFDYIEKLETLLDNNEIDRC